MAKVTAGAVIQLHYVGKLKDGTVFDSTSERGPVKINVGAGELPSGFEDALVGMTEGEKKSFPLSCDDAFGQRNEGLVRNVPRSQIEGERAPQVGDQLRAATPEGGDLILVVTNVNDETITVDGNHPLAGRDLFFDVEVVGIVSEGAQS